MPDDEMIKLSPCVIIVALLAFILGAIIIAHQTGYRSATHDVMYDLSRRCYPEGSFIYHQGVEYYAFTCKLK